MNSQTETKQNNRAFEQAKYNMEDIKKLVKKAQSSNDRVRDRAVEEIQEYPLSVEIEKRYIILLSTGGPATRIIGVLDVDNIPETATLQYQDWFTCWTDYVDDVNDEDVLLEFARQLYFGE